MGTGRPAGQHLTGAGALMSRSCEVGTSYREHQESEVLSGQEQGKITGGSRVVRMAELWMEHVQTPLPRPQNPPPGAAPAPMPGFLAPLGSCVHALHPSGNPHGGRNRGSVSVSCKPRT